MDGKSYGIHEGGHSYIGICKGTVVLVWLVISQNIKFNIVSPSPSQLTWGFRSWSRYDGAELCNLEKLCK